jgi:hypothetical protein
MPIINLSSIITELQSVTDNDLRQELNAYGLSISDDKFHNAFSAYGLSNFLSGTPLATLRANTNIPDAEMNGIRWNGVFILRGYISMVYMRSIHLERGLDNIPDSSPIYPFKRFFRSGSIRDGEDTIAQHIRNAFAHGTFELSSNMQHITFNDKNWTASVQTSEFIDGLCEQVFRFYVAAFHVK